MRSVPTVSAVPSSGVAASFPWTLARVVAASALMAVGAQVRIPVPESAVPMTLQLLAVLGAGLTLTSREAAASAALYVTCGVCGLPVLTAGSAGLLGPTGGYLAGFVLAAGAMPVVRGGHSSLGRLLLSAAVGVAIVLFCGLVGLTVWMGGDWRAAAVTGVAPFVVKAVIELFLAVGAVRAVSLARTFRRARD